MIQKLLRMLALTRERELTCDEVFDLMDYYTELEQAGENVQALMPQVAHHLQICPECREECEALLAVLTANVS
ncbi:MAG: hypothetical protein GXP37_04390 [Chloroflexi bacterium]|nr:hypothetical protein [Chloroflexota bacterium]